MLSKRLALALTALLLLVAVLPLSIVKGQSKTIVVPDNYSTLTAAIGNATAGDTILVRSGTYEGPINKTLTINKSVSIIGQSATNTIINLHPAYNSSWILTAEFFTYTDAITITAANCALMNLKLVIANPGGYITATGNRALIANNNIVTSSTTGLEINSSNCRITNNTLNGALPELDGGNIQVFGSNNQIDQNVASYLYLNNASFNVVKENSLQGLTLQNSTNNLLIGNRIENNFYGSYGIDLVWSNNNLLFQNQIYGTIAFGLRLWFSSNNVFEANTVSNLKLALASLYFGASYNNLFWLNNFFSNASVKSYIRDDYSDVNVRGMVTNQSINIWSDNSLGNYWDKYLLTNPFATEVDTSGVWGTPFVLNGNNTDPYPLVNTRQISTLQIQMPSWSNLDVPQLISSPTFPASNPHVSPSLTPSPSIPEFSSPIVVCVFVFGLFLALLATRRKTSQTPFRRLE